jgi:hypothetical protein
MQQRRGFEMKLSELSMREYIALEVLPGFVAQGMLDRDAAFRAFGLADEFLKRAGREHDKIASIKRECDRLEAQNSLLLNIGEPGNFGPRVALLEIWELLGAKNQTEAMDTLRSWNEATQEKARD